MIRMKTGKAIIVLLSGILITFLAVQAVPAAADDGETSVQAQVEVLEKEDIIYGARVTGSWNVWMAYWALGKPDGWGAMVLFNGWISLALKTRVTDAAKVVVRVAKKGWWPCGIKVWVSADGWRWKHTGNSQVWDSDYHDYEFTVNQGNVRYIKIERTGGPWSWLSLDAAGVKGGDDGKY
jgi:hypothetical protein